MKVLTYIFGFWLAIFLITMRIKAPLLEGLDIAILFAGLLWLAYWTLKTVRAMLKKTPTPLQESKVPDAEPKKSE